MSYTRVSDHVSMALDLRRNQAYLEALREVITPQSVVLDVGTGLGVLGLLAATLDARRVFLVDSEDIVSVAAEIADANALSSRVTSIQGRIEEIDLPEKVDVILSVFTGNLLLNEDLLSSLFVARERFLKPQGTMIPQGAILRVVPVSAPEEFQKNIAVWQQPHLGLSFDAGRRYAANSVIYPRKKLKDAGLLAVPQVALEVDFNQADSAACNTELTLTITTAGECHGIAGWPEINLGGKWLSTAPDQPSTHWTPALLPLDPPCRVEPGDELQLSLIRPPRGDWTWTVEINGTRQTHSTFFSHVMSPGRLAKAAFNGVPTLSERGQASRWVLTRIDGKISLGQIAEALTREFPKLFADESEALSFVQNLTNEHA